MKIFVTGGVGFIGSAVVRHIIRTTDHEVVVVDALTYAATPAATEECAESPRYQFEKLDIRDLEALRAAFARHRPDAVMHLAAESHVDRSIDGPGDFIQTNIVGTFNMLQAALEYYEGQDAERQARFRFHHISTDEVFGSLSLDDPAFTETTRYDPRSPYSASKAASDHLVRAWQHTFGLPVVLSNCSNNYGPWQYPEKLIPVIIAKGRDRQPMPVYGRGANIRDWLHVDDHADALVTILERGEIGQSYNVGGNSERDNLTVVRAICAVLDEAFPDNGPHADLIEFVDDRPGHDFRYAINADFIREQLGWTPRYSFEDGIAQTVRWYLANEGWWRDLLETRGAARRLGVKRRATGA